MPPKYPSYKAREPGGSQSTTRSYQGYPSPSYVKTPPKCGASHGFFFVNGSPFLHTKSRNIYFRSIQEFNNRGKFKTMVGLNQAKTKYKYRDFTITDYHGDNEFEHLHNFLSPAHLHTCSTNEHIGNIKRSIRTIKKKVICRCTSIPYKKFTKIMKRSLVQDMITRLNSFTSKDGISSNLGPAATILG